MRKILGIVFLASTCLSFSAHARNLKLLDWNFTAPATPAKSNITNIVQAGTIVHDLSDDGFYAMGSSGWVALGQATAQTVYLDDRQTIASGGGGACTASTWNTRPIRHVDNPVSYSWISLSANQITLTPGTYQIEATAPAFAVDEHAAKLYDVTNSTDILIGSSDYSNGVSSQSSSKIQGSFTVSGTTTYEIQQYCTTHTGGQDFGTNNTFISGTNLIFLQAKITKIQ
ncbi:MAG: hypothetical protein ACXWPM_02165 [Bdellovibrionota bacterium]